MTVFTLSPIIARNSGKLSMPDPSMSTFMTMSWISADEGFCPKVLMIPLTWIKPAGG